MKGRGEMVSFMKEKAGMKTEINTLGQTNVLFTDESGGDL
jgi:hypothetical protein